MLKHVRLMPLLKLKSLRTYLSKTSIGFLIALVFTICYVVIYQLLELIFLFLTLFDYSINSSSFYWANSLLTFCHRLLFALIIVGTLNFVSKKVFDKAYYIINILIAAALGITYVYLQIPLNHILSQLTNIQFNGFSSELSEFKLWDLPLMFSSVLIVPIVQELFFRGFLLDKLSKSFNQYFALIISSLLFAAIHYSSINSCYIAFFGGIIAGLIFLKLGLVEAMAFHIFWNLTANLSNYINLPYLN